MDLTDDVDQPSDSLNLSRRRCRPRPRRMKWHLAAVAGLCLGGLLGGPALPASASCAPNAPMSPHVFTGTVISTEREGRVAHVQTDDGQYVVVVGTPSESGVSAVDRSYDVGVRYEFHPLNATSPFQDNICTRTHPITSPAPTTPPITISPSAFPTAAGEAGSLGTSPLAGILWPLAGGGAYIAISLAVELGRHQISGSR